MTNKLFSPLAMVSDRPEVIARRRSGGRRYERGRQNLIELYLPLCDRWIVYDNSHPILQIIAERPLNQEAIIYQPQLWSQINTNTYE